MPNTILFSRNQCQKLSRWIQQQTEDADSFPDINFIRYLEFRIKSLLVTNKQQKIEDAVFYQHQSTTPNRYPNRITLDLFAIRLHDKYYQVTHDHKLREIDEAQWQRLETASGIQKLIKKAIPPLLTINADKSEHIRPSEIKVERLECVFPDNSVIQLNDTTLKAHSEDCQYGSADKLAQATAKLNNDRSTESPPPQKSPWGSGIINFLRRMLYSVLKALIFRKSKTPEVYQTSSERVSGSLPPTKPPRGTYHRKLIPATTQTRDSSEPTTYEDPDATAARVLGK